ncbi:phage holin [Ligilactobacillus sp. LYQ135]
MNDLITIGSFILAIIVTGYILFKKPAMTNELLQALEQFAKDAVVVAEKAGLTDKLLDKKQYAIQKLQDMLTHAGFTKQDEELLSDCIEHAYCELKQDIEAVYASKSTDKVYKLSETTDANGNIKPELGGVVNEENK